MEQTEPSFFVMMPLVLAFFWCAGWGLAGTIYTLCAVTEWSPRFLRKRLSPVWSEAVRLLRQDTKGWHLEGGSNRLTHAKSGITIDFDRPWGMTVRVDNFANVPVDKRHAKDIRDICMALKEVILVGSAEQKLLK